MSLSAEHCENEQGQEPESLTPQQCIGNLTLVKQDRGRLRPKDDPSDMWNSNHSPVDILVSLESRVFFIIKEVTNCSWTFFPFIKLNFHLGTVEALNKGHNRSQSCVYFQLLNASERHTLDMSASQLTNCLFFKKMDRALFSDNWHTTSRATPRLRSSIQKSMNLLCLWHFNKYYTCPT